MHVPAWLRHAFSVADGPLEPTPQQSALVERIASEVVRRHLSLPALMALEISRPLNYVASQALHFFRPLLSAVFDARQQEMFAEFLEHRGSVEFMAAAIERHSAAETSKRA